MHKVTACKQATTTNHAPALGLNAATCNPNRCKLLRHTLHTQGPMAAHLVWVQHLLAAAHSQAVVDGPQRVLALVLLLPRLVDELLVADGPGAVTL